MIFVFVAGCDSIIRCPIAFEVPEVKLAFQQKLSLSSRGKLLGSPRAEFDDAQRMKIRTSEILYIMSAWFQHVPSNYYIRTIQVIS